MDHLPKDIQEAAKDIEQTARTLVDRLPEGVQRTEDTIVGILNPNREIQLVWARVYPLLTKQQEDTKPHRPRSMTKYVHKSMRVTALKALQMRGLIML